MMERQTFASRDTIWYNKVPRFISDGKPPDPTHLLCFLLGDAVFVLKMFLQSLLVGELCGAEDAARQLGEVEVDIGQVLLDVEVVPMALHRVHGGGGEGATAAVELEIV